MGGNEELINILSAQKLSDSEEIIKALNMDEESKAKLRELVAKAREEKSIYISKFRTETPMIDKYFNIIARILIETKASMRSGDKSMMTPRSQGEGHVTSRGDHQKQVAQIMEELSQGLSLNVELSRLIGQHHDDGHTFNGHTGEEIMSSIGRLLNCGYTVHNALSIEMLIEENAISRIKEVIKLENPNITPEELEKLEDEMYYVYDGILSHNGEGTDRVIKPNDKTKENIQQEIKGCHIIEHFDKGIVPRTMEGALIRFADIIAYTRTDILDGFQLGILHGFEVEDLKKSQAQGNEAIREDEYYTDYLKIIGLLSQYNSRTDEKGTFNRINIVNAQSDTTRRNMRNLKLRRKSNIQELNILEDSVYQDNDLQQKINILKTENDDIDTSLEELEAKLATLQREKAELDSKNIEAGEKFIKSVNGNKYAITDMMQQVFIKDLLEFCKDKDYIGFSPAVTEALFDLRSCNMKYIVKYTRRKFETTVLPTATLELVKQMAQVIVDSGFINKVLPDSDKRAIDPQIQKAYIAELEAGKKGEYQKKLYKRCLKMNQSAPNRLMDICNDAMASIKDIITKDLKIALGEKQYLGSLPKEYEVKMEKMRTRIKEEYSGMEEAKRHGELYIITAEQQRDLINKLILEQRANIEMIFSYAIAKEYVAGMSDSAIIDALVQNNIINHKDVIEASEKSRNGGKDKHAQNLEKTWLKAKDEETDK